MDAPGLALGSQLTIECAVDVKSKDQTTGKYQYFITQPNDFGVFWRRQDANNTKSRLVFKTDPYRSGSTRTRSEYDWEGGRYLTVMVDADGTQSLFNGVDPTAGSVTASSKALNVPETRWSWGCNGDVSNGVDDFMTGSYYSLRLYNRALTQEELAHNRRIDDMRFHGTEHCNVRLQSATIGAEGAEKSGCYDVNGIHEFTRPASVTVGDAVYAPAGYQLEVWNAEANAWNVAGVSSDANFTYTNCLARRIVRVTWLWEMSGGKLKLDARAYASLGLLANFDGVSNAGVDVPHDGATTTWRNLAAGPDARIEKKDESDASCWSANGYNFLGRSRAYMNSPGVGLGSQLTIQIAADVNYREQAVVANGSYPYFFANSSDFALFYFPVKSGNPDMIFRFKTDPHMSGGKMSARTGLDIASTRYITAMIGDGNQRLFLGTDPNGGSVKPVTGAVNVPVSRWAFAGAVSLTTTDAPSKSHFHSLRLYDRALTSSELKYNRIVDDARFHGLQSLAPTGLVEIAESEAGNASVNDVVYWLKSGAITVSAPESVTRGGVDYVCVGYRVERVNQTYGFYETVASGAGTTCEIAADPTVNRRVKWLWRANRLRAGNEYDVGDYVQEGLVSHFDAIRNKGADLPHDLTAYRWRNLVRGMCDAEVVKSYSGNANADYNFNDVLSDWTETSYKFAGRATAQMDAPGIGLGNCATIECAVDVDVLDQTAGKYQYYLNCPGDAGIFSRRVGAGDTVAQLHLKLTPFSSPAGGKLRPRDDYWAGGRYITATVDAEGVNRLFYGTDPTDCIKQSPMRVDVQKKRFTWGAGHPTNRDGDLKGDYRSIRFYNRVLTQAELARNRMIDDVRFHGAVVTNVVVVASSHEEAHGVETNGVYAVDGSWTFTAEPMVLESGKTARPSGYRLETLTPSGWGNRTSSSATSYTWTEGDAPVRLTWRYLKGITIIIR